MTDLLFDEQIDETDPVKVTGEVVYKPGTHDEFKTSFEIDRATIASLSNSGVNAVSEIVMALKTDILQTELKTN